MTYTPEQVDFIRKAETEISNDPTTRLSDITRQTLQRKNFVFDAHTHIFDGKSINVAYLATRMMSGATDNVKSWIWHLITGKSMAEENFALSTKDMPMEIYEGSELIPREMHIDHFLDRIENFLSRIESKLHAKEKAFDGLHFQLGELLFRYKYIIDLLRMDGMARVYEKFKSDYAVHNVIKTMDGSEKEFVAIALGMDLNSGWEGKIPKSYREQNEELANVAKQYPIIPFLPIDPRRVDDQGADNLYALFLDAFNSKNPKYFGVKCYPALGYLPSDYRLQPIFEICARKKIPVLTHCGREIISTFDKEIHVYRGNVQEVVNYPSREARARFLNEPKEWAPVLDANPGLIVCLAHFGGATAWEDPDGVTGHRIQTIIDMMKRKDVQVYSDFSANLESKASYNFVNRLKQENEDSKIMLERTMFGTDFWVALPTSNLNLDQQHFLNLLQGMRSEFLNDNVVNYLGLNAL